jgi:ELP3 family radical SAM enzyme/protein acetyltransferase
MACSTTGCAATGSDNPSSNEMDIEDIYRKNTSFTGIDKITSTNIIIYKGVVILLFDWVKENSEKTNIKALFAKKFASVTRDYSQIFIKKSLIVFVYRKMLETEEIEYSQLFWSLIQKSPSRNISGITSVTLLTSPYPNGQKYSCKHDCFYCPAQPDQPRSYLDTEPAVARANRNGFDAKRQTIDRLDSLLMCGHEIDKIEFILEGGTYTEYPVEYLEEFHRDIVYCCNTYFEKKKRDPLTVSEEIEMNAKARVRISGICIETRPDAINDAWILRFRRWGVTRVQIGVQHLDNDILKRVNRGHTVEQAVKGLNYLKNNGFKVDIHIMPDLPGSTPRIDRAMFDKLLQTNYLTADQIKIYPCEVTPWTRIQKWYQNGEYRPYSEVNPQDLVDVLKYAMEICPPWVRYPRVIRDIPSNLIEAGNKRPNLRQIVDEELAKEDKYSMDIRNRECGRHPEYKKEDADYVIREYTRENRDNTDYFISLESRDRKVIFGFLRLRIPDQRTHEPVFDCLEDAGLVRELHVYGEVVPVGFKKKDVSQHGGVGKRLLELAEEITYKKGKMNIAVISGVGVVDYYKKRGYSTTPIDQGSYLVKNLDNQYKNNKIKQWIFQGFMIVGMICFMKNFL